MLSSRFTKLLNAFVGGGGGRQWSHAAANSVKKFDFISVSGLGISRKMASTAGTTVAAAEAPRAIEVLYEHTRPFQVWLLRAVGVSQFGCIAYMTYTSKDLLEQKKQVRRNPEGDKTTLARVSRRVAENYNVTAVMYFGLAMSALMLAATMIFTSHFVRRIHLVDRHWLHLETYGALQPATLRLEVGTVKALRPRHPESKAFLPLKVQGRFIVYPIDQQGNFPMPKLFDRSLGVSLYT